MTDSVTSPDSAPIEQTVDAIQRKVQELDTSLKATRTTRSVIVGGFLVLIVVTGGLFYSLGRRVQDKSYQQELLAAARTRIESNSDLYMKQLHQFVDDATPVVTKAFYEQSKKDMPLYLDAISQERSRLLDNLEARLNEQVDSKYGTLLKQIEQNLVKDFPEASDPVVHDQMIANVRQALNRLVKRYYVDEFKQELAEMYEVWDSFPVAAAPDKDDPPLEDQLVGSLLDLMVMKAAGDPHKTLINDADTVAPVVTEGRPSVEVESAPAEAVVPTGSEPKSN